jgi:hypothetical protein
MSGESPHTTSLAGGRTWPSSIESVDKRCYSRSRSGSRPRMASAAPPVPAPPPFARCRTECDVTNVPGFVTADGTRQRMIRIRPHPGRAHHRTEPAVHHRRSRARSSANKPRTIVSRATKRVRSSCVPDTFLARILPSACHASCQGSCRRARPAAASDAPDQRGPGCLDAACVWSEQVAKTAETWPWSVPTKTRGTELEAAGPRRAPGSHTVPALWRVRMGASRRSSCSLPTRRRRSSCAPGRQGGPVAARRGVNHGQVWEWSLLRLAVHRCSGVGARPGLVA